MSSPMLFLFGAPRLEVNRKPVPVDTRKAFALIAYLAITRSAHSRDALATLLWEEYDQSRARAALRRTLSVLNAALGGDQLEIERESIGLSPRAVLRIDVQEFQKRLAECEHHNHPVSEVCPRCITPLSEASALYQDDFMAGFTLRDSPSFDEWQFFQSEELRHQLAGALERLTRYHGARAEYGLAIVNARRWLSLDSLHEPAHRQLMQLYAAADQRAAALRQYLECARVLQQELGVAPLEETTRLYQAIKEHREQVSPVESRTVEPALLGAASYALVGRTAELAALNDWYRGLRSDGHFVLLEGEAGIGKTRLAEAFLIGAQARGAFVISTRFYEGGANLAYGPFIEALRGALKDSERAGRLAHVAPHFLSEAARLLPELHALRPHLPDMPALDSPGAQSRFFEGVRKVLATISTGISPGVFFVDDLQWADAASLDLLSYLIQRLSGFPLFLLGTWRGDQVPTHHRLTQLLEHAQRSGAATRLPLARLRPEDVMELVQSIPGAPQEIAERLYRETEGLPFFVVEYLTALANEPNGIRRGDWSIPGGVRRLLQSRLASVGETGWQLLNAAAVIGRSFDFDTLRETSGRTEEETVASLERVIAQGLIREVGTTLHGRRLNYDFTHEKLRGLVYEETSQARRRLLHRRAAESLVAHARVHRDGDAIASQVAYHYQQAGEESQAAEYFRRAGEHARSLYANAEAFSHFSSALALQHPDVAGLQEAVGDIQTLMGDYGAALAAYETAARVSLPRTSGRLEHKRGNLHHRRGEWEMAERHYAAALGALETASSSDQECARLYADWSLNAHRRNESDQARRLAERALDLAQRGADSRALAQAHNILGILANSRGEWEQAQEHLETSAQLAERLGDPGVRAAAFNNLALTYSARGQIEHALGLTQTALELCAAVGDRHREAALHNNLADLYHSAGQSEDAMAHLKQAVRIFSEMGEEAGGWQPEIWKLVEW